LFGSIPPISYVERFLKNYPVTRLVTFKQNGTNLANLFNAQYMYIFFCDLFDAHIETDYEVYKKLQIMSFTGQSFIHEFEGLIVNFIYGAYSSAARTTRWILESTLASTIATIDSSIMNTNYTNSMSLQQFQNWLEKHDSEPNNYVINKKLICEKLGLSNKFDHVKNIYAQLSKFSHLSTKTFSRPYADPNFHTRLSINQPLFNNVFSLTIQTIDLSLFCFIQVLSKTTNMPKHDLKSLMEDVRRSSFAHDQKYHDKKNDGYLLPRNIPLTWSIMKKIIDD